MPGIYKIQKVLKKQRRCCAIICRECEIESSDLPTKYLGILNAGLSTGLTEERVVDALLRYDGIKLVMVPGKSYAFIVCDSISEAQQIYECLHNKATLGQNGAVVFLSYFVSVPNYENPWKATPPEGLILLEDFITEEEENRLLQLVHREITSKSQQNTLKKREVLHFGYEFLYDKNNVNIDRPLKRSVLKECDFLWIRLQDRKEFDTNWMVPDQLTVNIYRPGQGIPAHVDTHSAFLDPIISLSLESDVVMDFRRNFERFSLILPRRSLLIMSKESRYDWIHGIASRVMDIVPTATSLTTQKRLQRTSFTFRKVRGGSACNCAYRKLCDSQRENAEATSVKNSNAGKYSETNVNLEETNVHAVYEKIAGHFSETRHKPWPQVAGFIDSLNVGSVLLDVGCGNGKYLYDHPNMFKLGCDRSKALLSICTAHNRNVFKCDCISLPLRSSSVDACISIAVIHHLATSARRLSAIKEMARVLVTGGLALVYVWARDQRMDNKKSTYLRQNKSVENNKTTEDEQRHQTSLKLQFHQPNTSLNLPIHTNRTEFQQQDILVPWKLKSQKQSQSLNDNLTFLRFYHVFESGELEALVAELPDVEIVKSYYDQGNHCVIFKKQ